LHKKINIVDVLKVSPDSKVDQKETDSSDDLSSNDDEDDDFFDESDGKVDEIDENVTNFIESAEFCQLRKRFNYPNSISEV
jgi:hypothetical protein